MSLSIAECGLSPHSSNHDTERHVCTERNGFRDVGCPASTENQGWRSQTVRCPPIHLTTSWNENRLLKEHNLYKKEADDQQRKVDRMVAENGDEWEIKNAVRSLSLCLAPPISCVVWTQHGNETPIQCDAFGGA